MPKPAATSASAYSSVFSCARTSVVSSCFCNEVSSTNSKMSQAYAEYERLLSILFDRIKKTSRLANDANGNGD